MAALSEDDGGALDARHRFMLKDIIDLRRTGWTPRLKVDGPKKIIDIHREAAAQQARLQCRR